MNDILEQVKKYDTATLRAKLLENGIKVGPIPPTTVSLFQRRLAKHLFLKQGGTLDDEDNTDSKSLKINEKPNFNQSSSQATAIPKSNLQQCQVADVFYAICLPNNVETGDAPEVNQLVFTDKDEALKLAKKIKGSRFKVFKSERDAHVFTRLTAETAFQSPRRPSKEEVKEVQASTESSPYKAPKPQDLAALRKIIEAGDVQRFKNQVWNNPRYLVSGGDTPAIYQEGPRYMAMHVAALKNKPEMCQAILDILEDTRFVSDLYCQSKNTEEAQNSRINFLVDMYLNMPDKGNCDSPLHMACKFGFDKVIEVLAAHPRTDKQLKNKWGDTPKDLICTRCSSASTALKQKIEILLQGQCYVPLIRSDDNTSAPVIGQPWSPDVTNSPLDVPCITNSPRDPTMSIRACAGPMSPSEAGLFHKRWTTPPSQSPDMKREYFNTKRSDCEKGMERIGRQLATELHIPWNEYWEFLDQFIDVSTSQGLETLEQYFRKRIWFTFTKDFKDKHCIVEDNMDSTNFSTPVINRARPPSVGESVKSLNSVFEKEIAGDGKGKTKTEDASKNKLNDVLGKIDNKETDGGDIDISVSSGERSNILSPMTNLAQTFSKLKLLEESWSEKATVATSGDSEIESTSESVGKDADGGLTGETQEGKDTDRGLTGETQEGKDADEGLTGETHVGKDTDRGLTGEMPEGKDADRGLTGETQEGKDADRGLTGEMQEGKDADRGLTGETQEGKDADGGLTRERQEGKDAGRGLTGETLECDTSDINDNVTKVESDGKNGCERSDNLDTEKVVNVCATETKDSDVTSQEEANKNSKISDIVKEIVNEKTESVNVKDGNNDGNLERDEQTIDSGQIKAEDKRFQRLRSTSSGSSGSFETASEGSDASSLSYCSQLSEPGDNHVCVRINDSAIFKPLVEYMSEKSRLENEAGQALNEGSMTSNSSVGKSSNRSVCFILQWKTYSPKSGQKVSIVSVPGLESASKLLLLEDVAVASCDGDMSRVLEGDVLEIGLGGESSGAKEGLHTDTMWAFLTRAETLPKCGYIHGPQPTREDLNVSRALGDALITPDKYPNVFRWKINLSRFLRDTNYRWQSPARLKSGKMRQSSPQPSPLGKTSPVIPYGSPVGLGAPAPRNNYVTSDIRTKLFPSIVE